jgi:hypothetical protein
MPQLHIVEETLCDDNIHKIAEQLISPGGTLDRFAYSICYISYRSKQPLIECSSYVEGETNSIK